MEHTFLSINDIDFCVSKQSRKYTKHNCHEVIFLADFDENTTFSIDADKVSLIKNGLYLIGENQVHKLKGFATGLSISFESDFFYRGDFTNLRILFSPFINEGIPLKSDSIDYFQRLKDLAVLELETTNINRILVAYLVAFLNKINSLRPDERSINSRSKKLETLFNLIEQNYLQHRSVSFYAKSMGVSTKTLNKLLNEKLGYSLSVFIHRLVILESKRRLSLFDTNIFDVSHELGFKDQAYFSRFFKKHTGMTPTEYKNQTSLVQV